MTISHRKQGVYYVRMRKQFSETSYAATVLLTSSCINA